MGLWCMVARENSKFSLPSEGGGLGSIPSRPTNLIFIAYEQNEIDAPEGLDVSKLFIREPDLGSCLQVEKV